jgi:hypothetical protein
LLSGVHASLAAQARRKSVLDSIATADVSPATAEVSAHKPVVVGHALGTGRRREAVARVRVMPGTGQWLINGRALDAYFPNKVHQMLISEPFVTIGAESQFDVVARITRWRRDGPGRGAAAWNRQGPDPRRSVQPTHAQAAWLPNQGRNDQGA